MTCQNKACVSHGQRNGTAFCYDCGVYYGSERSVPKQRAGPPKNWWNPRVRLVPTVVFASTFNVTVEAMVAANYLALALGVVLTIPCAVWFWRSVERDG